MDLFENNEVEISSETLNKGGRVVIPSFAVGRTQEILYEINKYAEAKGIGEKLAKIPVYVDIASEYRYTEHIYRKKHLIILISQSGETADTLAVLRKAKEQGIDTMATLPVWLEIPPLPGDMIIIKVKVFIKMTLINLQALVKF